MRSIIPLLCGLQVATAGLISRNFPHLIVPVSAKDPDNKFGTKYGGDVQRVTSTEILFDVPSNGATWCNVNFQLDVDNLHPGSTPWYLWDADPFRFNITSLASNVNKDTDTWNSRPALVDHVASVAVYQSGKVVVTGGDVPCKKGQPANFIMHIADPASGAIGGLTWIELDNPVHGITFDMYS